MASFQTLARLSVLFAASAAVAPALAQTAPATSRMVVDFSRVPGAFDGRFLRQVRFDSNARGTLTQITDSTVLQLPDANGQPVPVTFLVELRSSAQSYPDESEAQIATKMKGQKQYGNFAGTGSIDGAAFEVDGFSASQSSSKKDTLQYYGAHHGKHYTIMVDYDSARISTDKVREAIEKMRLPAAEATQVPASFAAFSANAVAPEGLRTSFGPVSFKEASRATLGRMNAVLEADEDPLKTYYLLEFSMQGAALTTGCAPLPTAAGFDQAEFDRKIFEGPATANISAAEPVPGTELRHYRFDRKTLGGGSVKEEAWVSTRGGHATFVSLGGYLKKDSRESLVSTLAAAGECGVTTLAP